MSADSVTDVSGVSIDIRPASESDKQAWNHYVAAHPEGTPYHAWAWGEALRGGYALETHYLAATDVGSGRLRGVLPAARVPGPLARGQLCSLPYCDRGEPLADDPSIYRALINHLHQRVAKAHEVRGSAAIALPLTTDDPPSTASSRKVRLLLELPDSSEALMESFKSKHRSQINKARKNGLTATLGNTPERVAAFFDVFARNMRELGSPTHARRWFNAIASAYADDCTIGLVNSGDTVIGAGIVLRSGERAAIPWASTLRDYNRLAPNMLLYWTLLANAADSGVRLFDFGRSTVGEGTYRFKRQWGAAPVPLDWRIWQGGQTLAEPTQQAGDNQAEQGPGRMRNLAEACWRALPLGLTISLGSRLRPWISL